MMGLKTTLIVRAGAGRDRQANQGDSDRKKEGKLADTALKGSAASG